MEPIWYINGNFVPQSKARISANDSGLIRGYAFFEYARTYNGAHFMLKEHIDRLFASASYFDVAVPHSKEEVIQIVDTLLEKNALPNAGIKMLVSGGDVLDLIPESQSALYIYVYPFSPFPQENYTHGISLKTAQLTRPFPECKTSFYLPGIMARRQAIKAGFDEGLYVNTNGHLLECPTSNLFFLRDGTWHTPKDDILKGITRDVIFRISPLPIEERNISIEELPTFEEVVTTSTNRAVMPISRIDTHPYNIGPASTALIKAYAGFVETHTALETSSI